MPSLRDGATGVLLALAGCEASDGGYYEPAAIDESPPLRATIDTDAKLADRSPGRGVGVFVEYHAGGEWRVDVGCDTALSMVGCSWLVFVEPLAGTVSSVELHDLESSDDFEVLPTSVGLQSTTTEDLDGVSFRAEPGAIVSLFAALDGYQESRFVFWVGGGAVHKGAPEVPFELEPDLP